MNLVTNCAVDKHTKMSVKILIYSGGDRPIFKRSNIGS